MPVLRAALLVAALATAIGSAAGAQEYRGDSARGAEPGRGYDPQAQYGHALAALNTGDYATAARAASNVIIAAPDSADGWRALAVAKAGAGEWRAAEAAYLRALRLAPGDAVSRAGLATARARLKDSG
jgi:Tfp pilus assembly protein PilF